MPDRPQVVLSGFGDEAAVHKTAVEQFAAMSAAGLQYYSLRFIDLGSGVKNVMKLTKSEITHAFETKLIRGFSFYPPKGDDPHEHVPQAANQLAQIAEMCHRSDLTF